MKCGRNNKTLSKTTLKGLFDEIIGTKDITVAISHPDADHDSLIDDVLEGKENQVQGLYLGGLGDKVLSLFSYVFI